MVYSEACAAFLAELNKECLRKEDAYCTCHHANAHSIADRMLGHIKTQSIRDIHKNGS